MAKLLQQYLSFRNEGHEFYVESYPDTVAPEFILKQGQNRLPMLRAAMPYADLSITLERELLLVDGQRKFRVVNVETGEVLL